MVPRGNNLCFHCMHILASISWEHSSQRGFTLHFIVRGIMVFISLLFAFVVGVYAQSEDVVTCGSTLKLKNDATVIATHALKKMHSLIA